MPSKRVISILIISSALVFSIIMVFKPDVKIALNSSSRNNGSAGVLTKGPEIKVVNNVWQNDLASVSALPAKISTETVASSNEPITDQLTKTFMANYLSMKQTNSLNNDSIQTLIDKSINFIDPKRKPAFNLSNILVDSTNSTESIRAYGNSIGELVKIYQPNIVEETNVLSSLMQDTKEESLDTEKIAKIKQFAEFYRGAAIVISKVQTPSKFLEKHLLLINSIDNVANALEDMTKFKTDPVIFMRGIGSWETNIKMTMQAIIKIKEELSKSGVVYKQGEGGYYLFYGI